MSVPTSAAPLAPHCEALLLPPTPTPTHTASAAPERPASPAQDFVEPTPAPRLRLLSREGSILAFNRRVLAQAQRPDVPLLERLRYLCIVSSNMDEFFEVRFADTLEAARRPGSGTPRSSLAFCETSID